MTGEGSLLYKYIDIDTLIYLMIYLLLEHWESALFTAYSVRTM